MDEEISDQSSDHDSAGDAAKDEGGQTHAPRFIFDSAGDDAEGQVGEDNLPIHILSTAWMDWLGEEGYMEQNPGWHERQHIHLDFSDCTLFDLHQFQPRDFNFGGKATKGKKQTDKLELPVFKLISCNLNDNHLNDTVFELKFKDETSLTGALFTNLRILKMNNNLLQFPQMLLPQLRELYLSRNQIVWVPLLAGMPQLEILILSHNQIASLQKEQFETDKGLMPALKILDLSNNLIEIKAKNLNQILKKFKTIFNLANFQLKCNPFCNYFSEYQMLTVHHLPALERLDDLDLEKVEGLAEEMQKQARMYFGFDRNKENSEREERHAFDILDKAIEERKKPIAGGRAADERKRLPRVPEPKDLVKLLDDAFADPDNASTYITLIFEDACHLMKGGPEQLRKVIEADRKGVMKESLVTFVQSALLLVERYPVHRMMLMKSIAKFSLVVEETLMAVAQLATGEGAPMDEVMIILEDNVLCELTKTIPAESLKIAMGGLSQFDHDNDELAQAMEKHNLVQLIVNKLTSQLLHQILAETDKDGKFQNALLKVLRCAVKTRASASKAMPLCDDLANLVRNEFPDTDRYSTDVYLNITEILCACISHDAPHALADMPPQFPHQLVELAYAPFRQLIEKNDSTTNLKHTQCRKVAGIINVITAIMTEPLNMESLLNENFEPGHYPKDNPLCKLILKAPSESAADPVVLAASLNCCLAILENAPTRCHLQYLKLMTRSMDLTKCPNKILPYLETKKFKELYRRCQGHQATTEAEQRAIVTAAVPEFNACTNKLVHNVVQKIVMFLGVFTVLDEVEDCADLAENINGKMNEAGRDRLLLKLLEIPSSEVQEAVLRCMKSVSASQLDKEEIDQMFEMLNPDDVKKEEYLMGRILELFLTLIQDETEEASDQFRERYAKPVLEKAYVILEKNAARNTHGVVADEQQKASLSMRAVELFFVASKQKLIRKHMRSTEITQDFKTILYNEMIYNSVQVQDINLEISWTGRQVENLMKCLSGADHLAPNKRQGFRIVHRVADVMEGGSDTFRRFDVSSQERAAQESRMWNDQKMKMQITYADEMEYDDRTHQQQSFVSFHGIRRLLTFLEGHPSAIQPSFMDPPTTDGIAMKPSERANAEDRVKEATAAFDGIKQYAADEMARKKQLVDDEFARDQEEEIKLFDEEEERLGDHECALRDKYMEGGWQASNGAQKAVGFSIPPQPRIVKLDESYFIPGTLDEVSIVYPLAALLRAVYSLLLVPGVERLRLETIQLLRDVNVQTRFISLIQSHGRFVDCHIAAKYLRVMSLALRMANDQTVAHMSRDVDREYITGLAVAASFAAYCLNLLTPLLGNMGRGYTLTVQQQTLCLEAMRMLAAVSHAGRYVKMCTDPEVQASCLELLLTHFHPMPCVQSILLSLLYDMQVNVGSSHGSFINAKYVRSSMQRQGLRELCCEVLVNIIHSCPTMRYEIFEMFFKHEVMGKVALRLSFLNDLIQKVEQLKYIVAMEEMIKQRYTEPGERVLRCVEVDLPLQNTGGLLARFAKQNLQPRMLVVTNKRFLIMERPRHGLLTAKCGHCPPESFCPVGPSIETERNFMDISRIIRGVDTQMFVIGWIKKYGYKETIAGEDLDIIICHRSDARRTVVETLCTLSGPDVESRVEPQRDMLIKQTSEKRLETPPVVMSFAYREESGKLLLFVLSEGHVSEVDIEWNTWIPPLEKSVIPDVSDDEREVKLEDEADATDPALLADDHVKPDKTRLTLHQFETSAQSWFSGDKKKRNQTRPGQQYNSIWRGREDEVDEIKKNRKTAVEKALQQRADAEKKSEEPSAETGAGSNKHSMNNIMRKARQGIFQTWTKKAITQIELIEFGAGEEPVLRLEFNANGTKEVTTIKFLDDVARERWRRGLAYILNKSDTAAQWQRKWEEQVLS